VTIGKCAIAKELAVNSGVGVLTQNSKFVNSPPAIDTHWSRLRSRSALLSW